MKKLLLEIAASGYEPGVFLDGTQWICSVYTSSGFQHAESPFFGEDPHEAVEKAHKRLAKNCEHSKS